MSASTFAGAIDHFVLAAPDLAHACDAFERATGVQPVFGGAHPGRGTHNALVSFDASSYLEIIAPDPAQQTTGLAAPMAALRQPTLMHWAIRCSGLAPVATHLRERGWAATPINRMSRTPPGGATLEWELFGLHRHRYGGLVPFFIDWLNAPRPATTSPVAGALTRVELAAPEPDALRDLLGSFGLEIDVAKGRAHLAIAFASPRGVVRYEGVDPRGFTLGD